jgi:hypothetical protein
MHAAIALWLIGILDTAATAMLIQCCEVEEANPLLAGIIEHKGLLWFTVLKILWHSLWVIILMVCASKLSPRKQRSYYLIALVAYLAITGPAYLALIALR